MPRGLKAVSPLIFLACIPNCPVQYLVCGDTKQNDPYHLSINIEKHRPQKHWLVSHGLKRDARIVWNKLLSRHNL